MLNRRVSLATQILVMLGIGRLQTTPGKELKSSGLGGNRNGNGSVKADQRAAAKRRNVIRNRNAHKGK